MAESTSPWRGRRVLVTGCTGFLGGAVVEELLSHGAEVVGLVRNRTSAAALARHQLTGRVHIVHGRADDLFRLHSALAVYEVHAVFHLVNADQFERTATTVLDAVRRYDPRIPVVVARPAAAASLLNSPVPLGVARFGELFGRDPKAARFVPSTVAAVLAGGRVPLAGERGALDYVHVGDAARACVLLAESLTSHPIPHVRDAHFRSGWVHTDPEMLAAIREACVNRYAPNVLPVSAANPLGWSPALNFAEAMADTVEWYRQLARSRVSAARLPVRAAA